MVNKDSSGGIGQSCEKYYLIEAISTKGLAVSKCDDDRDTLLDFVSDFILSSRKIEILSYKIEGDCFLLLINQKRKKWVDVFINEIIIKYNNFYYKKYKQNDLFDNDNIKIKPVDKKDLLEISLLIHSKPEDWDDTHNTSIRAYFYGDEPDWVNSKHIKDLYPSACDYYDMLKNVCENDFSATV